MPSQLFVKRLIIISNYNNLVEVSGVKLASELKYNLLENMLKIFIRVRSFSFAKDLTYKQKLKLKTKNSKGVRKQIKQ